MPVPTAVPMVSVLVPAVSLVVIAVAVALFGVSVIAVAVAAVFAFLLTVVGESAVRGTGVMSLCHGTTVGRVCG